MLTHLILANNNNKTISEMNKLVRLNHMLEVT